ncbi:MAG: cobalt transporter CbiM, partial [Gammaproteobacteria bacterium]|nr:cobalt transporter CbiM [Gammaproteobacteria bacterium]
LSPTTLPTAALFAAVFFVVGTLHIPVGIGSVHLILNGLIGLLLGWLAFPVIFVALILQALLFSFGGFIVLGANTLLLATPAVLAHFLLRPFVVASLHSQRRLMLLGLLAATIGIGGATSIASVMLWATGQDDFFNLIVLFSAAQLPAWLIDGLVSALVVAALGRALPSVFLR